MINLEVITTGGVLGRKLMEDPEEMAYALSAMIEVSYPKGLQEIADCIPFGEHADIAEFLEGLAKAIRGAS